MISDFFAEQQLTFDHVKCLTAAMFQVAKADGVHDREMTMIRDFYEGCSRAGDPRLEQVVVSGDASIDRVRKLFDTAEMAKMFVKSLILLAFADGKYAHPEDELIRSYAQALNLTGEEVDHLHEATKEYLLAGLAHVQNNEALAQIAKELDLN